MNVRLTNLILIYPTLQLFLIFNKLIYYLVYNKDSLYMILYVLLLLYDY